MITSANKNFYNNAAKRLRSAQRILAVTHLNPDGDALGSLCFLKELTLALNKDCLIYCAGPLPSDLEFLPHWSEIVTDKTKFSLDDFDLIISLDCATPARTNLEEELSKRTKEQHFLEIDHHPVIKKLSDSELRLPQAASTTEILFHLASIMNISINPIMAKTLLTGIVTDTGNFIHASATEGTVAAAAAITAYGANLAKINDQTFRTKTLAGLKLWGLALARLKKVDRFNLVYTVLTEEDFQKHDVTEDSLEGIANFLSALNDVAIVLVLFSARGVIKGSLRTIKDNVDVARLARALGGGGHVKAAGFTIPGQLVLENDQWLTKAPNV
jgi:phosphoesterase RecJ-like protein